MRVRESSGAPMRPLTPSCWKEYASRGVSLRRVTRSTPSLSVWRLVTRRAASCICSAAAVVGTGDGGGFSDQGYEFQSRRVIVRLDPRGRRDGVGSGSRGRSVIGSMRGRRTVLELAPFPRASHEPGIRGRVHRCRPDCVSKAGALRRSRDALPPD